MLRGMLSAGSAESTWGWVGHGAGLHLGSLHTFVTADALRLCCSGSSLVELLPLRRVQSRVQSRAQSRAQSRVPP